ARESVRERRTMARIAPHAVRPLLFAVPIYRSLTRGKLAMRAGFLLDRLVAAGRNRGVGPSHRLPAARVTSRGNAVQRFPGLRRQGLTGAGVMYDYVTTEADRLTFSFAVAAFEHGAVLANHVEAVAPLVDGTRVLGVSARDTLSARTMDISATLTVNATGAAVDRLLKPIGLSTGVPMVKAMNLVTKRDAGDEALGGRSTAGRYLFLVPWRERALFGTWESDRVCDPDDTTVSEQDLASFISELNQAFPALDLSLADVTLVHRGVVPAVVRGTRVTPAGHEQIRDHATDGIEGLVSIAGTKFTTARAVAERVTDLSIAKLKKTRTASRTATTPLPGGSIRDVGLAIAEARREYDTGLPTDTIPHLIGAYGSRYRDVLQLAAGRADWRTRIAAGLPVIGAQLVVAARSEMAVTLADAIIRRTPIGALGYPGDEALERAAAVVGGELGWSAAQRQDEIDAVKRFYGIVNALKT
ncbi:MAG TPA: glycerol-3-phosphate dehydrogenase C-terminal domain-containing protein, partial [Vicinamibacterales bacterium]|nr:glycerol-3-phosphate dehydrogenase C-terminal domain-containing protein [Vicinamibacterales bacterium]